MKLCLWVDDERPKPVDTSECEWLIAKSFHYAITLLQYNEFDEVSLDHDIASFYGNKEMTGYDIVMWLVQRKVDGTFYVPPVIKVHTANPVGRDNMKAMIDRYLS
ncbi:hypothetical protein LCGC14_1448860 [marine sediment metagenome]|uniref:Cyclic-phosphate processing Receiver domain-containing protein n=1 Tax=marine sediment metagenome TaxID=412755 RepID=A0A0F9LYY1_9ZZZZ